jgi:hypothetical protein
VSFRNGTQAVPYNCFNHFPKENTFIVHCTLSIVNFLRQHDKLEFEDSFSFPEGRTGDARPYVKPFEKFPKLGADKRRNMCYTIK